MAYMGIIKLGSWFPARMAKYMKSLWTGAPSPKRFKKWQGFRLKADEFTQVLIPPGFVNGYCVLSDEALFHYKLAYDGRYLDADEQLTVKWE